MIHIFVGTKAQLIKMAPIMQELDRRVVAYNFIDSGQHAGLMRDLLDEFELRAPDVCLRAQPTSIATLGQALLWATRHLGRASLRRGRVFQEVFSGERGVCLIHGDTLTTLVSLVCAKRCGIKVAHVEAGLRSRHWLDPFPEEIIRSIAMWGSDLLFAPSDWAAENLQKMGYGAKTVAVGGNTVMDAIRFARQSGPACSWGRGQYAVASIHRVETIYSPRRLVLVTRIVERIAREFEMVFVTHEPTGRQLRRLGLADRLSKMDGVRVVPLQPYLSFLNLLAGAEFVVADGGSIQEECYYLGVPCLILRKETERMEGLGENAVLCGFAESEIERFLATYSALRRRPIADMASPSRTIVEHLLRWA